jgi:hypothetical protein
MSSREHSLSARALIITSSFKRFLVRQTDRPASRVQCSEHLSAWSRTVCVTHGVKTAACCGISQWCLTREGGEGGSTVFNLYVLGSRREQKDSDLLHRI